MTYLRPRKKAFWHEHRLWIGLAVFAGALVALIEWRVPYIFEGAFTSLAEPFWRVGFSIDSGALHSPAELLAENESLKRQVADAEAAMTSAGIDALRQENEELKAEFGRSTSTPHILSAVLARPPLAPYDEFIIDVGADTGISTTTLAFGPNGILIGRVADVLPHTAKVVLFSSPGETYPVLIGPSHIPATAVGQGGGQYRADMPHGAAVHEGDGVVDSMLSDGVFGTVTSVSTDPANPFDTIYFAPPVNIYAIRWVFLSEAAPVAAVHPAAKK